MNTVARRGITLLELGPATARLVVAAEIVERLDRDGFTLLREVTAREAALVFFAE